MNEEILLKILSRVETIGTELAEFKQEIYGLFEQNKQEMYSLFEQNRTELTEFKQEVYGLFEKNKAELAGFKQEVYGLFEQNKAELTGFKQEVYGLFEKNTLEVGTEIRELAQNISTKMGEIQRELHRHIELNQKDHTIFRAQIEKIQLENQYLESKNTHISVS